MDNYELGLDAAFHALADPTRRAVLQRLSLGSASVSDLAEPFNMALPSFVKHIAVLEKSRLISSYKLGRVRTCRLERENFAATERWFEDLRAQWASRYTNLDKLLIKLSGKDDDI